MRTETQLSDVTPFVGPLVMRVRVGGEHAIGGRMLLGFGDVTPWLYRPPSAVSDLLSRFRPDVVRVSSSVGKATLELTFFH
jgi:hypothetical protein